MTCTYDRHLAPKTNKAFPVPAQRVPWEMFGLSMATADTSGSCRGQCKWPGTSTCAAAPLAGAAPLVLLRFISFSARSTPQYQLTTHKPPIRLFSVVASVTCYSSPYGGYNAQIAP